MNLKHYQIKKLLSFITILSLSSYSSVSTLQIPFEQIGSTTINLESNDNLIDSSILYGGVKPSSTNTESDSSSSTSEYLLNVIPQSDINSPATYYDVSVQDNHYDDNLIMTHNTSMYSTTISSKQSHEIKPLMIEKEMPQFSVVNVDGSQQPVKIIFRTMSSPIIVRQIHIARKSGKMERKNSIDEPQRVLHAVIRPVIQEVREIIQPYRQLTQEIRPVLEEIHTIVSKNEPQKPNNRNRRLNNGIRFDSDLSAPSTLAYPSRERPIPTQSQIKFIRIDRDVDSDPPLRTMLANNQFKSGNAGSLIASPSSSNYNRQMIPKNQLVRSISPSLSENIFGKFHEYQLNPFLI